ncbi:MAG TPA: HU family DNA-binding protein [Firmicutes bacterium]|nr:HU family DNA-binding protein [Bacillota bacterium]
MNKADLVATVAEKVDLKKKDVEAVVGAVFDTIGETLAAGEKVQLVGFGTFAVKKRAARVGRNPQTGKEIKIAASVVPTFKAGKLLRESVAKK